MFGANFIVAFMRKMRNGTAKKIKDSPPELSFVEVNLNKNYSALTG